jgi:carbon-monoxide dehydrogenase medium subunit
MFPDRFAYHAPRSLPEALALLTEHGTDEAKILAGGQSLIPLMKLRFARPEVLIDITRIPELRGVRIDDGRLTIGATTAEAALEHSAEVRRALPILHDATRVIADPSVRNLATVGGNLAHGDPANDHPAVMSVLDASVVVEGPAGPRTVPITEFFLGFYDTALQPGEVLRSLSVPVPPAGTGTAYEKFERQDGDFAIVATAVLLRVADGQVAELRVAFTNIAEVPVSVDIAALDAIGAPATPGSLVRLADAIAEATEFRGDLRGSATYKRAVAAQVTETALLRALGRAVEDVAA